MWNWDPHGNKDKEMMTFTRIGQKGPIDTRDCPFQVSWNPADLNASTKTVPWLFTSSPCGILISIWQGLRRCHDMSLPNTRFWKWSNGVKRVEMDLFWCISMTNNVYSCKKINGRAQTFKFSVFTMGRQELLAKNMKELRKLGKLKRLFLNFFKYYDPPRVAPCERAWPGLSENV